MNGTPEREVTLILELDAIYKNLPQECWHPTKRDSWLWSFTSELPAFSEKDLTEENMTDFQVFQRKTEQMSLPITFQVHCYLRSIQ